ncbi:MAG TPA: Crp/Fnr family transcriptional regulator [Solirubrobacteraceae bacterium]|nr:Crp/Fnr family transcriptional regulator [Solirubrobacteraceae bacterium]
MAGLAGTRDTTVALLEADPDLGEDLADDQRALAGQAALAHLVRFGRGADPAPRDGFDPRGHLGLLILDGLIARRVTIGDRTCAELLGEGDILRPWLRSGPADSALVEVGWRVVQPIALAVLDAAFARRIARWPEIGARLGDRMVLRARWLAFHLAVCHLVRVEERVHLVFWHLADRWGRVTPEGIVIPVPLTHTLLANVIGARRPSTTTAIGRLGERGLLERRPDGSWLLHGDPPETFDDLHGQLTGRGEEDQVLEDDGEA